MDCLAGRLLIHRIQDASQITKEQLFGWFTKMAAELEKYSRCRNGQCYRFLNPYSILVTSDDKILLLDLNASSNAFVIRNMQRPAMREHFVRPVIHMRESSKSAPDLYGLGKTIQFMLAHTESLISLNKLEEYLLLRIILKCLGENPKRKYENIKQVQNDLSKTKWKIRGKKF
ncbi:hypothetical protein [Luxibacter massiliensis]|uniref:hypothetical protein n=1 Tax=Luxibacter massiliensis TaxID=2219695 RepID=UPI000F05AF53|nr:hypothetical protein [Luxibacter massiliensis]